MAQSGPAGQRLAEQLRALREAADCSLQQIVDKGLQQEPPTVFTRTSLSEWFGGKAVPADSSKLKRLVEVLQPRATRRVPGFPQLLPAEWEQLRRQAVAEQRPGRAARAAGAVAQPGAAAQVPQTAAVEVRPVDATKAHRVLAALPPQAQWLRSLRTKPMDFVHIDHSTAFEEAWQQLRREVADFIDPALHEAYSALAAAAEALEYELDGMFGPDPGKQWRVLTNHRPQRPEQVRKLHTARDAFFAAYQVLVNRFNERDLLPHDPPTSPPPGGPAAAEAEPQRAENEAQDGDAIQELHRRLRAIVNGSAVSPLDLSERTGMHNIDIARVLGGSGWTAPPWEMVLGLLRAVGHDGAGIYPYWAAAHQQAVLGPATEAVPPDA